jgi:nitrate reductase NapAB chaperone NapD
LLRKARQVGQLSVSAYVFVSCIRPKAVLRNLRRLPGVVKADALAGSSEAIVVVEEESWEGLEALLSRIRDLPGVLAANSKLAA